jgi:hypothetical protein
MAVHIKLPKELEHIEQEYIRSTAIVQANISINIATILTVVIVEPLVEHIEKL